MNATIYGKILSLTKHYHLLEPTDVAERYSASVGLSRVSPGIGVEWVVDSIGVRIREELGQMVIRAIPELRPDGPEVISQAIQAFLKANVLNRSLFDADRVLLHGRDGTETLFDARASEPGEFVTRFWSALHEQLTRSVVNWITLYPVYRIRWVSQLFGFDGIFLLKADDKQAWDEICLRFRNAKAWDPVAAEWCGNGSKIPKYRQSSMSWLLCETCGTAKSAKKVATNRMRTFISALFAHLMPDTENILVKSMADTEDWGVQVPDDGQRAGCGMQFSSIGVLLPPMIVEVELSETTLNSVRDWYAVRRRAGAAKLNRVSAASQFLHRGIITDDIDRFLHFFIALDALFGVRNDVERTITNGIYKVFDGNENWRERAKALFTLRSELVHGGSSTIEDWKGLPDYKRRFRSEPLHDVGVAATTAFRRYFDV